MADMSWFNPSSWFSGGNTAGANTFPAGYGVGNLPVLPSNTEVVNPLSTGASSDQLASAFSALPGSTGASNTGLNTGFGMNIGTGQLAMSGLGALGNLWNSFQANKLANQQFDFTKGITNTNLTNQIKSYNTALTDRATSRGVQEGLTPAQTQAYITANSMTR